MMETTKTAQERATEVVAETGSALLKQVAALTQKMLARQTMEQVAGVIPHSVAAALPADRIVRIALMAVRQNSKLLDCTHASIIGAVIQAAQLGLVPDGLLGHAYLVPRRVNNVWQAQFQIGYRGLIQLAYRLDRIRERARVVHEGDHFLAHEGTDHRVEHVVADDGGKERRIICAYATAEFPDGGRDHRVLTMLEIDQAKAVSRTTRDDSPWKKWPVQMCEKTALHRLNKQLPLSTEVQRAMLADEKVSSGLASQVYAEAANGTIEMDIVDESTQGDGQ